MKRAVVLLVVLLAVGTLAYGVGIARQEAVYQTFIEQGDAALARDDNFAAIEAYTAAILHKADSMAAHLKRGEAYRRRHELDAAMRDLRRAAEIDPLAPRPQEILGDVNYAMGRYPNAVDHYREYLKLDDRSPRVLYKLALTYVMQGQPAQAATSLRVALGFDDRFAEAHYLLGVCLRDLRRPAEALASLERSVALNPALIQPREELVDTYDSLERFAERNRQLEALAALDPGGGREVTLALGYARDGEVERAVLRLGNAVRHFPDEREIFVALGRLWLERAERRGGRVELSKALGAFESGVGSDRNSEAYALYGRALWLSGDGPRAERAFQQALSRSPVDPLAYYYLADIAERRGRSADAHRYLVNYATLEGLDSSRLDVRRLVRLTEGHLRAGNLSAARLAFNRAQAKDRNHPQVRALAPRLLR